MLYGGLEGRFCLENGIISDGGDSIAYVRKDVAFGRSLEGMAGRKRGQSWTRFIALVECFCKGAMGRHILIVFDA